LKISKRLQKIEKMVTSQYDHIWDCCCDHGLLGFALLSSQANSKVHFVDIVPELMSAIEKKLERFYPSSTWETHCFDVAKLPLTQYQGKHLIIIAGVGGDLMIQFIEAINRQQKNLNIDFLLCPVHHQFSLRQKLIELDFSLKDEVLIEENRRFYEILLVSSLSGELVDELGKKNNKISPVGDKIWQSTSSKQTETVDRYLQKTLSHYQRIQQGFLQASLQSKVNNVQNVIDAYRVIK
jgi:tRNA (adenine22-N1)-methyltransferase